MVNAPAAPSDKNCKMTVGMNILTMIRRRRNFINWEKGLRRGGGGRKNFRCRDTKLLDKILDKFVNPFKT
jgi:hypothetical protein